MKLKQAILIIFVFIFLTGCNTGNANQEAERIFTEMYPDCEMNTVLRLTYAGKLFKEDRNTNFELEPTSNVSVIFPAGYNLRLLSFNFKENAWIEVKNDVTYLPVDSKYILGTNDPVKEFSYKLIGVIPSLGEKETLRVVVIPQLVEI